MVIKLSRITKKEIGIHVNKKMRISELLNVSKIENIIPIGTVLSFEISNRCITISYIDIKNDKKVSYNWKKYVIDVLNNNDYLEEKIPITFKK